MSRESLRKARLQNEYETLCNDPIEGMTIASRNTEEDVDVWMINVKGAKGTVYSGEQFHLELKLNKKYPLHPPDVKFVGTNIPVHPHINSSGDISLSTLTEGWYSRLTLKSICCDIMTMLNH